MLNLNNIIYVHVLTVVQNKNTHNVCYTSMVVELNRNPYESLDEMVTAVRVQTVLSSEKTIQYSYFRFMNRDFPGL